MGNAPQRNTHTKKINICMVDDDPRFCGMVSAALNESHDVRCTAVYGRCEALLFAMKSGQSPDVVLLDLVLPDMDGLEAIAKIKKLGPATRVIVLTAFDNEQKVFRAVTEGAHGFLLKGSSANELLDAIRTVAAGQVKLDAKPLTKYLRILGKRQEFDLGVSLTEREKEILRLLTRGLNRRDIADTLSLSYGTIETHCRNLHAKLKVHTDVQLVLLALGLILT